MGHESAYLYSPAFLPGALAPLRSALVARLPVRVDDAAAAGAALALRTALFGPLIVLTFPELWGGNITILLAAMIVVGFVRPGAWAFALLTKVTPALRLLWFAVRREWRARWRGPGW
ncbi:MAG: hypothetical protein R3C32_10255 [Chloroflexota bacterium]